MFAWEFSRALHASECHGWKRFVSMQNHYNLVYREEEREMIPLCLHEGIAVLPWSPLARGLLAGTRKRKNNGSTLRAKTDEYARRLYFDEHDFEVAGRAEEIARRRGVKPAQIAMAWLLGKPGVTAPVVGATSVEHVEEAVASLGISLDSGEIQELEACYRPHPVLGHEGPPR
jgi:aryl-alcohol dehydrogenase (NADP+)